VVGAVQVRDDDEVMLVTSAGVLIRMRVKEISVIGRNTQGVRLITLDNAEDKVVGLSRLPQTPVGEEEGGEGEGGEGGGGGEPEPTPDATPGVDPLPT
jgi:DNA gyrase subunit A